MEHLIDYFAKGWVEHLSGYFAKGLVEHLIDYFAMGWVEYLIILSRAWLKILSDSLPWAWVNTRLTICRGLG